MSNGALVSVVAAVVWTTGILVSVSAPVVSAPARTAVVVADEPEDSEVDADEQPPMIRREMMRRVKRPPCIEAS